MSADGTTLTLREGQSVSALPQKSDVNLLGNSKGVIDLDIKVADGALNFRMAKQELDGPQVAGPPVDQSRFGPSEGMRTEESWLQPDLPEPMAQDGGPILQEPGGRKGL